MVSTHVQYANQQNVNTMRLPIHLVFQGNVTLYCTILHYLTETESNSLLILLPNIWPHLQTAALPQQTPNSQLPFIYYLLRHYCIAERCLMLTLFANHELVSMIITRSYHFQFYFKFTDNVLVIK